MFVLLAGTGSTEDDAPLRAMAAELRGNDAAPRVWRDAERNAGAASLAPDFVPEDVFDAQPIVDDDGVFVCQARIDNRDDLLRELALEGHIADSALLAAAYHRWGIGCTDRVAGDFAFAAWHRSDGRVVGAVDPLGARRLFWARAGNGIALAAQLSALLAHPGISHDPDLDSLTAVFDAGIDRTSTPFSAIRAVPGGHRLDWRGGDPTIERWWNPPAEPAIWYRDPQDYVDETRELFTRAVAALLRSSSGISAMLSGGLDSGYATATAARLLSTRRGRITAYTSVPEEGLTASERPNWDADDRAYAAEVAASFDNIDHHLITPDGRCALDVLPLVVGRSRTPVITPANTLWVDRICREATANGSRVVLNGQHGNAGFSARGDLSVWELIATRRLRAALAQARLEARARHVSTARVVAGALRRGVRAASRRTAGETVVMPGLRFVRRPLAGRVRGYAYAEPLGSRRFWSVFLTTPRHGWSAEPVLQWGVEFRDPTSDRRLIERVLQYPHFAFRFAGRDRGLAREVAADLLPDRVRLRQTQGAQAPEAPGLIAKHAARYRAALDTFDRSPWCREVLDLGALRESLDAFAAGSNDYYLAIAFDRAFGVGLFLAALN